MKEESNTPEKTVKFEWSDEYIELKKSYVSPPPTVRRMSDIPAAPLSRVLKIMEEYQKHPSIWNAFSKVGLNGKFTEEESNMTGGFQHFLDVKYGDDDWGRNAVAAKIRKWVSGHYTGLDDPKLIAELLDHPKVFEG